MKRLLSSITLTAVTMIAVVWPGVSSAQKTKIINGAGATFPYPIYSKWAYRYEQTSGARINYQSIGSGGGIAQIKARTVDFGASDAPLTREDLDQAGLTQFPLIMGGVVPVINIKNKFGFDVVAAGQLKLTGPVLADIFLGKITKWDDPAITALNPGLKLPATAITVVHRSDGSGTTWIFTNYLSKVSKEWQQKVGNDKAVSWPIGVGGKGNEGVSSYVQQIYGAIGYVEFAYAFENKIPYALLGNRAGKFIAPSIESFQSAATNADWKNAASFYMVLTDQPGEKSWPITGASFILIYKDQADAAKAKEMLKFFDWSFNFGGDMAKKLHYVPIPKNVVELVENSWTGQLKSNSKPIWP